MIRPIERLPIAIVVIVIGTLCGCVDRTLPRYPLADPQTTREKLATQLQQVRTISGQGNVELRRPDGQSVRLDAALACKVPDHVRLRAWKFGRAVFDLTLTPNGLWLVETHRRSGNEGSLADALQTEEFRRLWRLLSGELFADPDAVVTNEGNRLVVRERGGATLVGYADRATLTVRQYEIVDSIGKRRFKLTLDRHRNFNGIVWPCRIVATSAQGTTVVELNDVEFNTELASEAFNPPRRARQVP